MFCPNCGLENQQAGAYCRRCGAIKPDPVSGGAVGPVAIGTGHHKQKFKKTQTAGVASGAFSLVSAVIILWTLSRPDVQYGRILAIAALCSLLVAAYQAFNFYLGRDIFDLPATRAHSDDGQPDDQIYTPPMSVLEPASFNTADLSISSVTEHTKRTLEPIEQQRGKRQK
jgi:hypothetical protein